MAERRRRRWRWLLLIPALLLVTATGLGAAVWWTLPATHATARIPGLVAPVEIGLDPHGIPRIVAANERDAAAALGWLHARDRLFQMETMRRGVSGRLSEWAGTPTLRIDRLMRTLGLARRAEADFAALPPETRAVLEAYARGVNALIEARGRFAAPEFLLLGAPEPWQPAHSLLWARLMGLWLSGSWRDDVSRATLAERLPPDRLAELWPPDTSPGRPDLALEPPRRAALGHDRNPPDLSDPSDRAHRTPARRPANAGAMLAAIPAWPEPHTLPGSASNAWALAAWRSASGAPLLASDPHLGFQAPILWYLARIELPDGRFRAGATSPGVPFVVIGRNERLAWGFTTTHSDTQDVFLERLVDADRYETPDGPRAFHVVEERIAMRGGAVETLRVRESRNGPVMSDLDRVETASGTIVRAVAMANLLAPDPSAAGLQGLNAATSLETARQAAERIASPPQNLMVAEAAGGIALYLTGRVPLRAGGDGTMPARGWDGSGDWRGFARFDALPHVERPASGVLVNANNRVAPPDHPVFLGRDWYGDWRFRRIGERLAERSTHDLGSMGAIQNDRRSLLARELLLAPGAPLAALPRPAGTAGIAHDLLRDWDGEVAADQPHGLIWNAWIDTLDERVRETVAIPPELWTGGPRFLRYLFAQPERGAWWCGGDCADLAARALEASVAVLAAAHGPDPARWRWGAVHVARFEHPLLRFVPVLRGLVRIAAPTGGDEVTVSRGGLGAGYAHAHGAGLRLVADLATPDGLAAVVATGQSGHPLSPHWADQLAAWRDGALIPLGGTPAGTMGRITLRP